MKKILLLPLALITSLAFSQSVEILPGNSNAGNIISNSGSFPAINMFKSGFNNPDKMIISHSPAYPTWGLQYQDVDDQFNFKYSSGTILSVDLDDLKVGVNTTAPVGALDIANSSNGSANPSVQLTHTSATGFNRLTFANLGRTDKFMISSNISSTSADSRMHIWYTGIGDMFTATGSGRIGIGTSDPDNALHVAGNDIKIEDGFPFLVLETTGTTGNAGMQIKQQSNTRGWFYYENSSSALKINATSSGTGAGGLNVKSSGFVGIGTESPNRILEISDTANPFIRISDVSGGSDVGIELLRVGTGFNDWRIRNSGGEIDFQISTNDFSTATTEYTMNAGGFRPGVDNTNDLGASSLRWDDVYATNGTIQTSDRREKENIKELKYGLDEVLKMNPVSYTWIEKPEKGTKVGLIAQDIAELVPEVVNGLENGKVGEGRLGMNYGELVPVLINAIQEQQKVIAGLERKNSELSASVQSINKVLGIESKVSNSRR